MTTTGACLALAALAAAVLVTTALTGLCRARSLERLLEEHDEAEALLADLDLPCGGAGCGCFWQYLDGGHLRIWTCDAHSFTCEPPQWTDEQIERLEQTMREDREEL